jgi:hypothetical protein
MRLSLNTTRMLERVERTIMRGQPHSEASNDFVALCMDAHRHKSVVEALLCAARQQLGNTMVGSLFEHGYLVQLDDHARTIAQRGIFKPARQAGRPVPRKCTCRCV